MSASKDKSQKFRFIYPENANSVKVLKSRPEHMPNYVDVREYRPVEFIQKRVEGRRPGLTVADKKAHVNDPIVKLKQNLHALNDLHSRLKFMLKELEDLVK